MFFWFCPEKLKGKMYLQRVNATILFPLSLQLSWHNHYSETSNRKTQKVLLNLTGKTLIRTY